ncbi:MAG: holo-[acyl-carrier-protein] synthase [Chloroflexi bacterium RBG_16_52_11]|nr:MAG: holo-[acyl-carrier-protein] synthase [Chloroflexi bacterium RBG_16_52_11]
MTALVTGVDLVDIERLKEVIDRYGERFLHRIFTQQELDEVGENIASLAGRFAAKEAVSKALGTGIGPVSWREIEILRGSQREPVLRLYGSAAILARQRELNQWSLSLSHTNSYAIAVVVAVG